MRPLTTVLLGIAGLTLLVAPIALAYAIPEGELDQQKVFWGLPTSFEKPGEVEYEEVIKKTDEFKQMKKERVERGTGKYWILMSQATDRAIKAIEDVGKLTDYDLIASQGYLGSLKEPIPADNVTDLVIDAMKGSLKIQKADEESAKEDR